MKQLTCEMCGSTDLLKQDGVFVCQSCGCKYSVEEAKKMMVEGTVDVSGSTVKIDTSDELANLYQLARRAKNSNGETAAKYYEMILLKDSSSWEATFYVTYFKAESCSIAGIVDAATSMRDCVSTTMQLIAHNVSNDDERVSAVREVRAKTWYISEMMATAAENRFEKYSLTERIGQHTSEYVERTTKAALIKKFFCIGLKCYLGRDSAVMSAVGIDILKKCFEDGTLGEFDKDYVDLIKEYEPGYELPEPETKPTYTTSTTKAPSNSLQSSSSGCYVATAVYGSYDCPQVWTLRRYRDYTLAETWYGRAFIRTYYAISPTLVKWFGHTEWFKNVERQARPHGCQSE